MTTPNYSNDVQVRFVSDCKEPIANGAGCNNTRVTEVLNFTAIIKPTNCPKDGKPIIVQIQPGTVKEYLTVELEVICECECEDPSHSDYEKDSDRYDIYSLAFVGANSNNTHICLFYFSIA